MLPAESGPLRGVPNKQSSEQTDSQHQGRKNHDSHRCDRIRRDFLHWIFRYFLQILGGSSYLIAHKNWRKSKKSSGDGAPKLQISVPCRGRTRPDRWAPAWSAGKTVVRTGLAELLREFLRPATTQNLAVKFDGEICGGVLVENVSDDFPPAKEARKSPSKLRRKFATNFAENFANFTLEIAGA